MNNELKIIREALTQCDEAMHYMSEYDIPIALPEKVKEVLAALDKLEQPIKFREGELLPCPFCGKEPSDVRLDKKERMNSFYIGCYRKECSVKPTASYYSTPESAIKAWNTRPQLETGMQSVSERSIDIPNEQPTVNELSQVKPSNKTIGE